MRFASPFVLGLVFASCIPAQTTLSGPVEALTFDAPTRSLRAVIGFPGAASFGPALMDSLDFASVAPHQNYALVFESGRCLFVAGLQGKKITSEAIAGVTPHPDGIVWSADGSRAILYSHTGNWLQAIAGFPGAPIAQMPIDISSLGSFSTIAVDATGNQIMVAVSGDNGAVYQVTGGQLTPLLSMKEPKSLSFSSDGQTVYALDAATAQVKAISINGNGFQTLDLPGMANPIAIQSILDSESRPLLYIAGGSDRMVRILDVATRQILADLPLGFSPTGLDPFGNTSFVLASRSQSTNPLWLFASTPQLGAYFVPAIQLRRPQHRIAPIVGRPR